MRLAALFSGGKDSTYSVYKVHNKEHIVECLITVFPLSDESLLLHYPNIEVTKLQSDSMEIPQIFLKSNSNDVNNEVIAVKKILTKAKNDFGIEGLVHGGILSEFQKKYFSEICSTLNISLLSPIWGKNPKEYMKDLINSNFHFIITSVSSDGLDKSWLGKEIKLEDLKKLEKLSEKYGFNLNFEGGEAETLVIDCPLFLRPLRIIESKKTWDGYRGRFEILEAKLDYNARLS